MELTDNKKTSAEPTKEASSSSSLTARIKKKILPSSMTSKGNSSSSPNKSNAQAHATSGHSNDTASEKSKAAGNKKINSASTTSKAESPTKIPLFGRRAGNQESTTNTGSTLTTHSETKKHSSSNLRTLSTNKAEKSVDLSKLRTIDSEDVKTHSSLKSTNRQEEVNNTAMATVQESQKQNGIANSMENNAPTNYRTALPKLAELESNMPHWDKMLQNIQAECDLTSLTSCLVRELDEDATWNPEMLLVQLTSDMYDAADLKHELAISAGKQFNVRVGKLRGGEVVSNTGRRRRSKNDKSNANNADDDDGDYSGHGNQNEIFTLSNNLLLPQEIGNANETTGLLGSETKTPVLSSMKITPKVLEVENLERAKEEEANKSTSQVHTRQIDPLSAKHHRKRNLASASKSRKSSVHSSRSRDSVSGSRTPKNKSEHK